MKKVIVSLFVVLALVVGIAPAQAAGGDGISGAITPKSEQIVPLGALERAVNTECSNTKMLRDRKIFSSDTSAIIEIFYKICRNSRTKKKWVRNGSMTLYYNHLLDSDSTLCKASPFRGFNFKNYWQDPDGRVLYKNHTLPCENDTVGRERVSLRNTTRLYYNGSGRRLNDRPKWHAEVTEKWTLGIPDQSKTFTDRYARRIR